MAYLRDIGLFPEQRIPPPGEKTMFLASEHYPELPGWWETELESTDDLLTALNGSLGLERYLGKSTAEFDHRKGGSATVDELSTLQSPDAGKPVPGVIVGNLNFDPAGNRVLVAVNGVFVTASPLVTFRKIDSTFIAMLPPSVLGPDNLIEVFLVGRSGLLKLEVSE